MTLRITANELKEMESLICRRCVVTVEIDTHWVGFRVDANNKIGQPMHAAYRITTLEAREFKGASLLPLIAEHLSKMMREEINA